MVRNRFSRILATQVIPSPVYKGRYIGFILSMLLCASAVPSKVHPSISKNQRFKATEHLEDALETFTALITCCRSSIISMTVITIINRDNDHSVENVE